MIDRKIISLDGIIFSLQQHGGISVYFQELINFLSKNKNDTVLNLYDGFPKNFTIPTDFVNINHCKARLLERYRDCYSSIKSSIFHSSYYRLPNKRNTPTVVTVHDFIYERLQSGPRRWVHSLQKSAAIRSAQVVICISESTKNDMLEFIGETRGQTIKVIHNGVSDIFKNLNLELSKAPYILYVGHRAGYKNFNSVVAALSFLPDFELHCVGGGPISKNELCNVADSVAKRVRHMGFVTDEELNVLYNRAICLVYPSSYEGFGIPVIEAMRAGCPVVSTDCKAVLEVGQDALTVVPNLDPRAIANAILKTTTTERSHLVQKGLVVAQDYSWDATHQQTLDVYRSLGA